MPSAAHASSRDRLELLLFRLGGRQRFAINVVKVKEVIPAPRLTRVPHAHPAVCGMAPTCVASRSRSLTWGRPSAGRGRARGRPPR